MCVSYNDNKSNLGRIIGERGAYFVEHGADDIFLV